MSILAIALLAFTAELPPVQTELPLRLVGVLLADDAVERAAVIRDERSGRSVTVREGGVVATAQVVHISNGRVLLRNWGRLEILASDFAWTERKSCASALANRRDLVDPKDQARVVPAFRDGQPLGFKLFSIRPDSFPAHAGMRNGDLVTGINGMHIRTPEEMLTAYEKLRCASRIIFTVVRDGEELTLELPP
jgi:general secretion pathway protein C